MADNNTLGDKAVEVAKESFNQIGTAGLNTVTKVGEIANQKTVLPTQIVYLIVLVVAVLTIVVAVLLSLLGQSDNILYVFASGMICLVAALFLAPSFVGDNSIATSSNLLSSNNVSGVSNPALTAHPHLTHVNQTCSQIYHQLSQQRKPFPQVLQHESILTIESNGDTNATETFTLKPVHDNLFMILRQLTSDSAISSTFDLNLQTEVVKSSSTRKVVYLPAEDKQMEKEVLLFFLPEVPKDQEVEYRLKWSWSGYWNTFIKNKSDTFGYEARSAGNIPMVRVVLRVSDSFGQRMSIDNEGGGGGVNKTKDPPTSSLQGYKDYVWEAVDVAPGTVVKIRIRKS